MPPLPLPPMPPFELRAQVLTPLASGETLYLADGRVVVDSRGRIAAVGAWADRPPEEAGEDRARRTAAVPVFDLRPCVLMPGLLDIHTHIPQLPNAGVGDGLDLLAWLDRYTLPLEARFDRATAERQAPLAFAAMAAAGTTT